MVSSSYQEYLELFGYFGRDGLPRLDAEAFASYTAELDGLIAKAPDLEVDEVQRVAALQQLLFRERPTLKQLLSRSRRKRL